MRTREQRSQKRANTSFRFRSRGRMRAITINKVAKHHGANDHADPENVRGPGNALRQGDKSLSPGRGLGEGLRICRDLDPHPTLVVSRLSQWERQIRLAST